MIIQAIKRLLSVPHENFSNIPEYNRSEKIISPKIILPETRWA